MLTEQQLKDIYAANLKPRYNSAGVNVGNYVDVNGMMQEAYRMALEDATNICDQFENEAMSKMERSNDPIQGFKAVSYLRCGLAIRHLAQDGQ